MRWGRMKKGIWERVTDNKDNKDIWNLLVQKLPKIYTYVKEV